MIGVVAGSDADLAGIAALRKALHAEGAVLRVIAPHGGTLGEGDDAQVVERTFATGRSIEFDALVVAGGAPKQRDVRAVTMLQEAFRHLKALAAWGDGAQVLQAAGVTASAPGVLLADGYGPEFADGLVRRSPCTAPGAGPSSSRPAASRRPPDPPVPRGPPPAAPGRGRG